MVAEIVRYILLGLAVLLLLGSMVFLLRAFRMRASIRSQAFNVLRLNSRRSMLSQAYAAVGALVLALILFAVGGLMSFGDDTPEVIPTVVVIPSLTPETVIENQPSSVDDSEESSPAEPETVEVVEPATQIPEPTEGPISTAEPAQPTPEPTDTVEPTPAPTPALVNSPVVGLYLRTEPGGEIIERLDDQVEVLLLGEEQAADNLTWVLVSSPSGSQGWVALDFLLVGQSAEDLLVPTETPPVEDQTDGATENEEFDG
ncbi:MAG: hypothetical protein QNJ45_11960 [Ardenticatenaceae bacterium]|nr:hypothetical protein [Ardenticatenaceae bacterium]